MSDDRFENLTRKRFEAEIVQVADQLRRIAEEVEREGRRTTNAIGAPRFARAARGVVHAVMWGLANAHLDGLLLKAAEADEAVNESRAVVGPPAGAKPEPNSK